LNKRGLPVVISAASGAGKSTIINEILKVRSDLVFSVSVTSREPRNDEVESVNYHFVTRQEFEQDIKENRFVEWEMVHGNYYGTDREALECILKAGKHIILDLDVNGGQRLSAVYPDAILIFLYPPSLGELQRRLSKRGTETEESIIRRLARYPLEIEKGNKYPHRVINDSVELTTIAILRIINTNSKL